MTEKPEAADATVTSAMCWHVVTVAKDAFMDGSEYVLVDLVPPTPSAPVDTPADETADSPPP
jgi:hypothetical protein